jgi:hypothetical protein
MLASNFMPCFMAGTICVHVSQRYGYSYRHAFERFLGAVFDEG